MQAIAIQMREADIAAIDAYCDNRSRLVRDVLFYYENNPVGVANAISSRIHVGGAGQGSMKKVSFRLPDKQVTHMRTLCNAADLAFDPLVRTLVWDYMRIHPRQHTT